MKVGFIGTGNMGGALARAAAKGGHTLLLANRTPAKAAALASSISPRKATADDFKAVQARLKAFVDSGQLGPFTNAYFLGGHPAYYLDPEANLVATAHYLEALRVQVSAAKAMAVFGAKNPHPQFLIPGGVTCYESLTPERIKEFRDLYLQARKFIEEVYIPDLLLVAGLGLIAVLLGLVLKKGNGVLALLLTLAACAAMTVSIVRLAEPVVSFLSELRQLAGLEPALLQPLLRTVGIGLLTQLTASVCADAGESTVARLIELCGSVLGIYTALPLLEAVLSLLRTMLEG